MKKNLFLLLLFALSSLSAKNLIIDSDCNSELKTGEFVLAERAKEAKLSIFVEPSTWNRALKLELVNYSVDKNGKRSAAPALWLGGTAKVPGFLCKPDTTYRFSMEVKGEAHRTMINFYEWNDPQKDGWKFRKKKRTSIHQIMPQKEWTVYRGTFKTSPTAKRAALVIQFWGDEARNDLKEKIGQYILIDKISVEEVLSKGTPVSGKQSQNTDFSAVAPAKLCVVPDTAAKAVPVSHFCDMNDGSKAAPFPTEGKIWSEGKALHVSLQLKGVKPEINNGKDKFSWNDDLVELFFAPVTSDRDMTQIVISAAGKVWIGNGSTKLSVPANFHAQTAIEKDGWRVEAVIPFSLLGFKKAPEKGSSLKFNIGRQHTAPGEFRKAPDYTKGNRWGADRMFDNSSFAPGYSKLNGILFFGTIKPYLDRELKTVVSPELAALKAKVDYLAPALAYAQTMYLQEQERLLRLSKEPYIVAKMPVTFDPSVPFMPDELNNPVKEFKLRGAGNEHVPLVAALANMTKDFEEYRVTLEYGWNRPGAQYELWMPGTGLKKADGTVFPADQIVIRRAVRIRDSEAANAAPRLDVLTKLNEVSTVPVPSHDCGLLWIDFYTKGVSPGVYKGFLTVNPLNSNRFKSLRHRPNGLEPKCTLVKRIPVTLEVLPFELDEDAMPLNGFRTAFSQYHADFLNSYRSCMFLVTPWYFDAKFNADGSLKDGKPRSFLEPHLQLIVKNKSLMPVNAKKVMVCYSAYSIFKRVHWPKKLIAFDTPEYWRAWREWSANMNRILEKNGISRKEYTVEVVDEPNLKDMPAAELKRACGEIKKAVPGISLLITNGSHYYMDALKDLVDEWIFSQHAIHNPERNKGVAVFRQMPGKKWSVYCCGTSMRQDLYRYYRIHPWEAIGQKAHYLSIYQFFSQQPGIDFLKTAKDGELVYDTSKSLVPSLRLEAMRAGITDTLYMRLLEKLAVGDSADAKGARKFLNHAAKDVVIVYPHDSEKAGQVRNQAIEWILKLQKK